MKRRTLLTVAASLAAVLGAAVPVHAADPLKVAFVYIGPVGDAGWTYAHEQGRLAMEKALAGKVKSTYVENVPEGADSERVIRKLAADGNKLIFTTSFGYMNATEKVAKAFPNVVFQHATGFKSGKNMGVYESRMYEGAYLLGVVAGKMTKSNTLGMVASFPVPEVIRNINAFTLGAQSVNPAIRMKVLWVNSWYDPAKERQAAETLIAQGADVLTQNTDSPATLQAAQEKGKYAFGWDSDMQRFAPKAHLTASTNHWGDFYTKTAQAVMAGTWKTGETRGGLQEGMVRMSPLNPVVPADAARLFEEKKAALASGKMRPFQGPLKDQSGAIKVPAGAELPLKDLLSMNWYVQGVEGKMPK
ncbi:BMP family ABC transporter substrate-binding protein [Pseudoduganella plicata]|uniref:BMP family ABC transporter substrate-binding protein n=1 Tax=Pseudoduganella plicata TaxID=321984 RepID=A0A4P7BH42_9BURK|nr:BMP family ABC transporter substrate-binding protein [Pseudoduganella plicata]QBQ37583.1 BMP family ABC transporter substrate-binding protein [Pseudoduganella plicata]GGY91481.1 BMP family ABC transporter substrate-binding protein [Pseudoduganella plicata]